MSYSRAYPLLALAALAASSTLAQTVGGCPAFPSNNVWNTPVDKLPVDANSSAYVNTIGASKYLHPDFSAGGGGIPYVTVNASQPNVPIVFGSASESDPGPYPVPPNAPVELGGDRHVLVLDQTNCMLYELYDAYLQADGSWTAGSGAMFDLHSNMLRPAWWTSADAAGFAILPGLVRYDEVMSGAIRHAIRMSAPYTRNQFIWPARHRASSLTGLQYPPMGQRFRLKANFDETPYPFEVQVILRALKKYGAILADNGSPWYLTGAPDPRWNDANLHLLHQVFGSNMEAVDESSLMVAPDSGVVAGSPLALDGVYLTDRQVSAGASLAATVILTAPAGPGGAVISLTTSQPNAASVPASVTIPAGAVSAPITVSTYADAPSGFVSVLASYLGTTLTSARLWVNGVAPSPPSLAGLKLAATTLVGGTTTSATVTLGAAAPAGGLTVSLSSSNPAVASLPATVVVPAGATSASATVTTYGVAATVSVTLTAGLNGASKTALLTVTPVAAAALTRISLGPNPVNGGARVWVTVYLSGAAPPGGAVVALSASNPALLVLPATVTVAAGATNVGFSASTSPVTASAQTTASASYQGVVKTALLTVNPATLSSLRVPSSVTGATTVTGGVWLNGIAAAPLHIALASSNPAVAAVPAGVTVPAGGSRAYFSVTTGAVGSATAVTITASDGVVIKTAGLTVYP